MALLCLDLASLVSLSPDVSLKLFQSCGLPVFIHLPLDIIYNSFDDIFLGTFFGDFYNTLYPISLVFSSLKFNRWQFKIKMYQY